MGRFTISRPGIVFLCAISLYAAASGCSKQESPTSSASRAPAAVHHVFFNRTNPLQAYIQDHWTNGSATATGGSHYPHIKIYGHSYWNFEGDQTDADFIAEHFDMYMWGGTIVKEASDNLNPSMIFLTQAGNIPHISAGWDSARAEAWMADPSKNPMGYDWGDLLLYFKYNTTNGVGTFPGWNPADDTDGSGCIDSTEGNNGLPSDSTRSAQCQWDARVLDRVVSLTGEERYWMRAKVTSPAYADYTADEAKEQWDSLGAEGFHFDAAAWEYSGIGMGNTFTYEGWSGLEDSFPYIEDKIALVPWVMQDVESYVGAPVIALANMVATEYICGTSGYYAPQHDYAQTYLENIWLEDWIPRPGYANTSRREQLLNCPTSDFLEQGKGIMFTAQNMPTERGQLFSLGMFYMINHQLAFYYYKLYDGNDVETGQWNPWVVYDVGQPVANTLDLEDFQGNTGTNKYFVYDSQSAYEILGREYQQEDGTHVLVLVKLMAPGQTPGDNSAAVALPGQYRVLVAPDGTLSGAGTSVTLSNNSAAILVEGTGGGSGSGKKKPHN